MKRGFFSLRRLRWKLTLSYTLVTVVALLMAELLFVAVLVALLSSPILPGFVVQDLKETVVPRVEPALSETPPDTEALREEMRQETWLSFDGGNLEQGAGSSDPALDTGPFPGLELVLTAALGGEEDPWSLQARSPDDRQLYTVAPVKDDEGRVLGAV